MFCSLMTSRYLEECLGRGKLSVNICEGAEGAKGRQETAGESPTLKGRRLGWIVWAKLDLLCSVDTYYAYLHQASPTLSNSPGVSLAQHSLGQRQVNIPILQAADVKPILHKSNQYPC